MTAETDAALHHELVRRLQALHALKTGALAMFDPMLAAVASARDDERLAEVSDLLGSLVAAGQRLLLVTQANAIPDWVTDVLELDAGRCTWQGARSSYSRRLAGGLHDEAPPASRRLYEAGEPILELADVSVRSGDVTVLDRIDWTVLVVGLAWRGWLLLSVLPVLLVMRRLDWDVTRTLPS